MYIHIYIYKRVSFGLRNTKECSMTYRLSETKRNETCNRAKYLKTYHYSLFHPRGIFTW